MIFFLSLCESFFVEPVLNHLLYMYVCAVICPHCTVIFNTIHMCCTSVPSDALIWNPAIVFIYFVSFSLSW